MTMIFRTDAETRDALKQVLIRYREIVLTEKYRGQARTEGILRRNMLDAILNSRPENRAEFFGLLPKRLIQATSREQLRTEVDAICRFVRGH